jgi:hypothetical protein
MSQYKHEHHLTRNTPETTFKSKHQQQSYCFQLVQFPRIKPAHTNKKDTYPLTRSSTSKMCPSWTILVNNNLQNQRRKEKYMKFKIITSNPPNNQNKNMVVLKMHPTTTRFPCIRIRGSLLITEL